MRIKICGEEANKIIWRLKIHHVLVQVQQTKILHNLEAGGGSGGTERSHSVGYSVQKKKLI